MDSSPDFVVAFSSALAVVLFALLVIWVWRRTRGAAAERVAERSLSEARRLIEVQQLRPRPKLQLIQGGRDQVQPEHIRHALRGGR